METEKRGFADERIEVRENDDGSVSIAGYAAVFDQEADIGGIFREVIRPGAFTAALARGDDVALLINHGGLPLARSSSATMRLSQDSKGLRVESTLDGSDPDVRRIIPKMRRGDLSKMSFGFTMEGGVQRWGSSGDVEKREIIEVGGLYDVSVVTYPAYDGTSIALRSRDEAKREAEAEIKNREEKARASVQGYFSRKAEMENKFRRI